MRDAKKVECKGNAGVRDVEMRVYRRVERRVASVKNGNGKKAVKD